MLKLGYLYRFVQHIFSKKFHKVSKILQKQEIHYKTQILSQRELWLHKLYTHTHTHTHTHKILWRLLRTFPLNGTTATK